MGAADRDLLFGLLALQNGLIDRRQLVAAFEAWMRDRSKSLADHLEDRGDLVGPRRSLLETLSGVHLEARGSDTVGSLAAVPGGPSTVASLAAPGSTEIERTLVHLGTAAEGGAGPTAADAVGSVSSDGHRFRVLRPHARGGLGAVFVALDAELHREVALKRILDQHADDPVSRARFVLEAEITGGLEHPGIVPVYGMGTYADGRPFYAMRFVKGDSLKEAVDRFHADEAMKTDQGSRSLGLRRLLGRFTDVCDAIDYAHSRGVLHRDLKPGNIIVGQHGETLVVDWGVAKAVGRAEPGSRSGPGEQTLAPSSASGTAETLPGSVLGTPGYMSPEQAEGDLEQLGPRSDVYSLGATLYYVLTGRGPVEGRLNEVLQAVRQGEFPPPRRHDPTIDRALEAVCLKAMAHRPDDRYASAGALAEDIERWMADEPVSAWREPIGRRARRWARRNRTVVATAAVAMLAGVVGLSAVLVVQTQAKADIARALGREMAANAALAAANDEVSRSKAAVQARYELAVDAIRTFHTGVSEDFLLREERFRELRDRLLKSASDFYGKLGALLGRETDIASRRALASANFELARLTAKVGRSEDALAAHRGVLESRRRLAAETGAGAAATADVGRSLTAVAGLLESAGKTDEALATFREAESLLAGPASESPEARSALAACRSRMGRLLSRIGKNEEALEAYRRARPDQEAAAAAAGASTEARRELADTVQRLAILLGRTGQSAAAEAESRAALAIRRKLADDHPDVPEFQSALAGSHSSLGDLLGATGKQAEAEAETRAALAIRRKLADDHPAVTEFRASLADSHYNLGWLLGQTGQSAGAEAEYRAALAIRRKLADDHPDVPEFHSGLASSHHSLSDLLYRTGKPAEAEAESRAALAIRQELSDDHPTVIEFRSGLAESHYNLGVLLSGAGRPVEAEAEYRESLAIWSKLSDDDPAVTMFRSRVSDIRYSLGILLGETGNPAGAAAEYRHALALRRKLADDNRTVTEFRSRLADSHHNLGILLLQMSRPAEAEAECRAAIALLQKLSTDNPAVTDYRNRLANGHDSLGWLLSQMGKPSEAESEYLTALPLYRRLAEDEPKVLSHRDLEANVENNLSAVLRRLGRLAEARDCIERAVAAREALVKEDPRTTNYRGGLAENLLNRGLARSETGDPAGAAADLRRSLELYDALPSLTGEQTFLCACAHAALASLAGRVGSGVSAAEGASQAETAMAVLHTAVEVGYGNLDAYRTEDALDPLRNRDDFRLLMMDLAMPAEPFARREGD